MFLLRRYSFTSRECGRSSPDVMLQCSPGLGDGSADAYFFSQGPKPVAAGLFLFARLSNELLTQARDLCHSEEEEEEEGEEGGGGGGADDLRWHSCSAVSTRH